MGIMSRVLRIADIISTDVRSRSRADIIRNELEENRSNLILERLSRFGYSINWNDRGCQSYVGCG